MQQKPPWAFQPAVWGISCLVLLPSPCNDSACTYHSAIFVKPQQWPTPSESIAIYCVRKLVSCITHLESCAKVDIWNKKKKLRTVAKIKTQGYKNWRLPKFSTNVTPHWTQLQHCSTNPDRNGHSALLTDKIAHRVWRGFCLRRSHGLPQTVTCSGKSLALPKWVILSVRSSLYQFTLKRR